MLQKVISVAFLACLIQCDETRPPRPSTSTEDVPGYLNSTERSVLKDEDTIMVAGDATLVIEKNDLAVDSYVRLSVLDSAEVEIPEELDIGSRLGEIIEVEFYTDSSKVTNIDSETLLSVVDVKQKITAPDEIGRLHAAFILDKDKESARASIVDKDSISLNSPTANSLHLTGNTEASIELKAAKIRVWFVDLDPDEARSNKVKINSIQSLNADQKILLRLASSGLGTLAPGGSTMVEVLLTNSEDEPIADEAIKLSADDNLQLTKTEATTNEQGIASFEITAKEVTGNFSVRAIIGDLSSNSLSLVVSNDISYLNISNDVTVNSSNIDDYKNRFWLISNGATVTIDHNDAINIQGLSISGSSSLTHSALGYVNLISSGDVIVNSASKIVVDDKGAAGASSSSGTVDDGNGAGKGLKAVTNGGGGGAGYGGAGGPGYYISAQANAGSSYGSATEPVSYGSGGGGGKGDGCKVGGGNGGGRIKIDASGRTITILGEISAVGSGADTCQIGGNDPGAGGAGSGGAIWLIAASIEGHGKIIADGGPGNERTAAYGGSGGGGRISIDVGLNSYSGTCSVSAGPASEGAAKGADGSLFINGSDASSHGC